MAGYGRLIEVKKDWDIDDLMDAHEALDIKAEAEHHANEMARMKS
jgi:hypothetical protein